MPSTTTAAPLNPLQAFMQQNSSLSGLFGTAFQGSQSGAGSNTILGGTSQQTAGGSGISSRSALDWLMIVVGSVIIFIGIILLILGDRGPSVVVQTVQGNVKEAAHSAATHVAVAALA